MLNAGKGKDLICGRAFAKRFIHNEIALTVGNNELAEEFFLAQFVEVFDKSKAIAVLLQRTDRLLESFFVILADAHDFTDSSHLCAEMIIYALEFFKRPAGEFNDNVITVRNIFVQRAVFAAGKVLEGKTGRKLCGDKRDREARSLGGKSGRAGCSGIDLNNDDAAGFGIVRELHVGSADDADMLYDPVGLLLQLLLQVLINSEHRRCTEGITCVYAYGIDVLDKAYGDHVVVLVADNFEFQFLPAQNGFFYKNLVDQAGLQAARAYGTKFISVVYKSAAGAAHCISRTKNNRITELLSDRKRVVNRISDLAARHLNTEFIHRFLEFNAVLATLNSIDLNTDDLNAIFI